MKLKFLLISCIIVFKAQAQPANRPVTKDSASVKVYLTFDDGPIPGSEYLVELAMRDSIPINIFTVGKMVNFSETSRSLFQSYKTSAFIEIFNHSYSHADKKYKKFYSKPSRVIMDVVLNEDTLNLQNKIARLPGRNTWCIGDRKRSDLLDALPAADSLAARGFSIFGWDLLWQYDSTCRSCFTGLQMIELINNVASQSFTRNHVVILCHDQMLNNEYTRQQLSIFVQKMKETKEMQFEYLSRYPR